MDKQQTNKLVIRSAVLLSIGAVSKGVSGQETQHTNANFHLEYGQNQKVVKNKILALKQLYLILSPPFESEPQHK